MEDEPEKLTEEEKKYVKIYPIYMDKTIKYSEGRKINIELCVENPRAKDIYRICEEILGLKCKLEAKSHPKDWQKRGRVLVQIKDNEGKVIQDSLKTGYNTISIDNGDDEIIKIGKILIVQKINLNVI